MRGLRKLQDPVGRALRSYKTRVASSKKVYSQGDGTYLSLKLFVELMQRMSLPVCQVSSL